MISGEKSGLVLNGARKAFQKVVAVDDLSFTVPSGSMFGLLGANGAGKTTTLRMILSILRPDAGNITWNGTPIDDVPRHAFGYLPEERGLYPKMKAGEELVFLAGLNDVSAPEATKRARAQLQRLGLGDAWNRKVEELSKGNQQKVQVLAAILHEPDLMLLDEPFSGLDPINTELLRETLMQRQAQGRTIIFSSHRLEQVEAVCDHVAIIHKGRLLTTGLLSDLRRKSGRKLVEVEFAAPNNGQALGVDTFLTSLAPLKVTLESQHNDTLRLEMGDGATSDQVLRTAMEHGPGPVSRFEVVEPTLQEIFIEAVAAADPSAVEQLKEEGTMPGGVVLTEG
ncbi:MAG TPA: ATP-binding cassette domain-containing protein [Chloroflexia bacterium]|nr:ATP-binding cassette domain-containing protein [Chloroflexia bacterium]